MIQNILKTLGGVQNYGIISLCLFCFVFAGAMLWTFTRRKEHLKDMARLPLEDNDLSDDNFTPQ